jgi:hypothetical protein
MGKGTVLIVDDEPAILRSLKALFDRDYHIITHRPFTSSFRITKCPARTASPC